jgi:transposase
MRRFNWQNVIFSDECSYERGSGKNATWVFRTAKQKWDKEMIEPKKKKGGVAIMVWGGFLYNACSSLILLTKEENSRGYNAIAYQKALERGLLPIYQPGVAFLQDNAPIHTAQTTQDWMQDHGVWVLDFPPNSPDLNVIEHAWWAFKKEVQAIEPEIEHLGAGEEDIERVRRACRQAWRNLDQELFHTLINSMPRRLKAVRKAKGWQTKY